MTKPLSFLELLKYIWILGTLLLFLLICVVAPIYTRVVVGYCNKAPGSSWTDEEYGVGSLLAYPREGFVEREIPAEIDAPEFIKVEVIETYSGGYYLNFGWQPRYSFTYRVYVMPDAPDGEFKFNIRFPSGEGVSGSVCVRR